MRRNSGSNKMFAKEKLSGKPYRYNWYKQIYMKVGECKQMGTIMQQGLETNFENFLCGKSINQEEASKIKALINKAKTTNQAYFLNIKTMTEQGGKIYMDNNDINYINSLKEMVDNGNLTQDQAKKIIKKRTYICQTEWAIVYFKNLFRQY